MFYREYLVALIDRIRSILLLPETQSFFKVLLNNRHANRRLNFPINLRLLVDHLIAPQIRRKNIIQLANLILKVTIILLRVILQKSFVQIFFRGLILTLLNKS